MKKGKVRTKYMKRWICLLLVMSSLALSMKFMNHVVMAKNLPKNPEIILIDRYTNFAWSYQENGYFLDTTGALYSFDFSSENFDVESKESLLEQLKKVQKNSEPVMQFEMSAVKKIYNLGLKINPNSKLILEPVAMDAGSSTISFRNPNTGEQIICSESGDMEGKRKDSAAKKLVKLYFKNMEKKAKYAL